MDRREAIQTFLATTAAMGIASAEAEAVEIPDKPWAAILKVPDTLTQEQRFKLMGAWEQIWNGLEPAPKCIVLDGGFNIITETR